MVKKRWMLRAANEILIVVSHTFRKIDVNTCTIRIISARKATRKEGRQYEE